VIDGAASSFADPALARTLSFSCAGAVVAAMTNWAGAGPERGALAPHLDSALAPVLQGFVPIQPAY
jgi:hypothetical protein